MAEKRILLANADVEAVAEFRRVFAQPWEVVCVASGPAALAELDRQSFGVLVADLDLPELDGASLLNQSRHKHPQTLCFILASDADRERVMENVLGAHQFLAKPCAPETLKNHIERALALDTWIASNRMRELVSRVRTFPTVPTIYLELLSVIKSPNVTTEQVGKIVARDMAMMTKLLQVINSACFGLPRKISDPVEAVGLMGFDAVKSMVMTIKVLSQYDKIKPVYFSIDRLWRHSTDVARSAKQLTLMHTDNAALGETAFTAGLIHDLGKVVLAANFDEQYRGAQSLARKQQLPLSEVEKEIFGASHGEIGAYLLGLWGMPLDLLECAALHHQPGRCISRDFTPLTAVHLANALEHEASPDREESGASSKLDVDYLAAVGVLDDLEDWRVAVLRRQFTKPEPKPKIPVAASSRVKMLPKSAVPHPAPAAPAVVAKNSNTQASKPADLNTGGMFKKWQWPCVFAGAGVVILLAAWFFVSSRSRETVVAPTQEGARRPVNSLDQAAATQSPTVGQDPGAASAVSLLSPTLVVRARTAEASSNAPLVDQPAPKQTSFADLRIQGILYSANDPSAIVSGKTVHENDLILGARVVEITPTSVLLEYQGQHRKLQLK